MKIIVVGHILVTNNLTRTVSIFKTSPYKVFRWCKQLKIWQSVPVPLRGPSGRDLPLEGTVTGLHHARKICIVTFSACDASVNPAWYHPYTFDTWLLSSVTFPILTTIHSMYIFNGVRYWIAQNRNQYLFSCCYFAAVRHCTSDGPPHSPHFSMIIWRFSESSQLLRCNAAWGSTPIKTGTNVSRRFSSSSLAQTGSYFLLWREKEPFRLIVMPFNWPFS